MTNPSADDRFQAFAQEYETWLKQSHSLPFGQKPNSGSTFETDLCHLFSHVQPIAERAAKGATQFDYPKVADEYLHDLDLAEAELKREPLSSEDRQRYAQYVAEFRSLLRHLGSLPVPIEGHLGFRKSALEAFGFLIEEYGFYVINTSPLDVHFRSEAMSVHLSYWPQCPMGSIEIATCNPNQAAEFTLDDIAYATGFGVMIDYDQFDFQSPAGVAQFLQRAAVLVRGAGSALLQGAPHAIELFRNRAEERELLYTRMMEEQHSNEG